MDTTKILTDLRAERDRLDQAIAALEGLSGSSSLGGEHDLPTPASLPTAALALAKPGRNISPEGRARIAAAARARWAKQNAAKSTGAGRNISAAGRKRIAEAAKKMWAERRKGAKPAAKAAAAGPRKMSPEARKRIAEGMRKRWAEKKEESKA